VKNITQQKTTENQKHQNRNVPTVKINIQQIGNGVLLTKRQKKKQILRRQLQNNVSSKSL